MYSNMDKNKKIIKKYLIKIPNIIQCLYCDLKNCLIIKGSKTVKIIKPKVKIYIIKPNFIYISDDLAFIKSKTDKKKIKSYRSLYKSLILQMLNNSNFNVYKRLTLKGIGYKIHLKKKNSFSIIQLKVGYSHTIFFKIPSSITLLSPNSTVLYVVGTSMNQINSLVSRIRSLRIPDPYKGKGILKEYETVVLKEGKKS